MARGTSHAALAEMVELPAMKRDRNRMPVVAVAVLFILFVALLAAPAAAELELREFVACNTLGLIDEDGDYPDWIELRNPGPDALDLFDYGLSDDPDQIMKWRFPARSLDKAVLEVVTVGSGINEVSLIVRHERDDTGICLGIYRE